MKTSSCKAKRQFGSINLTEELKSQLAKVPRLFYIKRGRKYWYKDLRGLKFGKLSVIDVAKRNRFKQICWICRCECGNKSRKVVGTALIYGTSRSCGCDGGIKLRKRPGDTPQERMRNGRLYNLFNLYPEDVEKLMEHQKGLCAITGKKANKLVVDHDHKTGLIRGLLSWRINKALASFEDNPVLLRAAADYLENPPAITALGKIYGVLGKISRKAKNRRYGPEGTKKPAPRQ